MSDKYNDRLLVSEEFAEWNPQPVFSHDITGRRVQQLPSRREGGLIESHGEAGRSSRRAHRLFLVLE
jgi:hypothetical protein